MKSHRESKEDLGLRVASCNRLREKGWSETGRDRACTSSPVQRWLLPVSTLLSYNRLQDNDLMPLYGCLPPVQAARLLSRGLRVCQS